MKKLVKESLNEQRFSTLEIKFAKEDIRDKMLDASWYVKEIEDNLLKVDLTNVPFKFDEAFDKLKTIIDIVVDATNNENNEDADENIE